MLYILCALVCRCLCGRDSSLRPFPHDEQVDEVAFVGGEDVSGDVLDGEVVPLEVSQRHGCAPGVYRAAGHYYRDSAVGVLRQPREAVCMFSVPFQGVFRVEREEEVHPAVLYRGAVALKCHRVGGFLNLELYQVLHFHRSSVAELDIGGQDVDVQYAVLPEVAVFLYGDGAGILDSGFEYRAVAVGGFVGAEEYRGDGGPVHLQGRHLDLKLGDVIVSWHGRVDVEVGVEYGDVVRLEIVELYLRRAEVVGYGFEHSDSVSL